jgi:CyaY protein
MDEACFNAQANQMLAWLEQRLDQLELDWDYQLKPGGIVEIECTNGSKVIVNRHGAAQEIWVAAKAGGFHFQLQPDGRWLSQREGLELLTCLSQVLSAQMGQAVTI